MHTRYEMEYAVMAEMHCSYTDVLAMPEDLIEEILVRREARLHWEAQKRELDKERNRPKK